MTLIEAKEGDCLVVEAVCGDEIAMQALRFGLEEGASIRLAKKLPGGPVIISKNELEIALGRRLAASITVSALPGQSK